MNDGQSVRLTSPLHMIRADWLGLKVKYPCGLKVKYPCGHQLTLTKCKCTFLCYRCFGIRQKWDTKYSNAITNHNKHDTMTHNKRLDSSTFH